MAGRMLFKHQLPAPPHHTTGKRPRPLLASGPAPPRPPGAASAATLVAVGVGARRVLLVRGDCRLVTVEAPAPVTAVAFLGPSLLLLGCASGALYRLPLRPLLARASDRHGVLVRLEEGAHRWALAWSEGGSGGSGPIYLLSDRAGHVVASTTGEDGSPQAVMLRAEKEPEQVACPKFFGSCWRELKVPGEVGMWACLDGRAARHVLGGSGGHKSPIVVAPTSGSHQPPMRYRGCLDSGLPGGMSAPLEGKVVAVLALSSTLLAVEESGRVMRKAVGGDDRWQVAARHLRLPPGEGGRVVEAVLLEGADRHKQGDDDDKEKGDMDCSLVLAYRTAHGGVWVARLGELFENGSPEAAAATAPPRSGQRLDLVPDAIALTGTTAAALFVLTRRARLVCVDARGALPPQPQRPTAAQERAGPTSSGEGMDLAEEEALVRAIEAAARATRAERARLAAAEAALERLRAAWAVVAGRELLAASLDVEHESAGPPRLWVRLQNPTAGEALPLRGWTLLVRLEPALEPPAPCFLLRRGRGPAGGGVMAGGSWPLDDLHPGERFQASLPLPPDAAASPLPVTARLALCYPFAAASGTKDDGQGWPAGICVELGSRPLDLLDLARAPRSVPSTPSELRALEVKAQGRPTREYDRALARLLLSRSRQEETEPEPEPGEVGPAASVPCPVVSSALKLLWPVAVEAGQPTPLPGLTDLLGACDGARMGEDDGGNGADGVRSLAIEAAGGRVLVARLLLGVGDGIGEGAASAVYPTVIVEEGAVPAVALQLTLSSTDEGLLGLLRAACLQRLGAGAAVRTRRLALTQARMRALERAHHETTALAETLAASDDEEAEDEQGEERLAAWVAQAARVVEVAAALGRELEEASLLDLRP